MTSSEHLLQLQIQIQELLPTLELFLEEDPNINKLNCENLQSQINSLEERLAIFKHSLSASTHEKINTKVEVESVELPIEVKQAIEIPAVDSNQQKIEDVQKIELKKEESVAEQKNETSSRIIEEVRSTSTLKPLIIGINDKFRFINELFAQSAPEYSVAIEQINSMSTSNEANNYLSNLKSVYEWQENNETVKQFYALVKKRYS